MLGGLFIASLIGTCAELFKESNQKTIPAENWANKELYHKDLMSGMPTKQIMKNVENGTVFKKTEAVTWQCRNCGFVYTGTEAPELCPACLHPQAHFEVKKNNY